MPGDAARSPPWFPPEARPLLGSAALCPLPPPPPPALSAPGAREGRLPAAMAQKPSRRQPTAAQLMDRKQHELYFQQMRELEHRKKLERVHQLEVMWEAEDRVQQKRVTRLLREEEHEQRLEEAVRKVGTGGERRGRGGKPSLVSSGSCSWLSPQSLPPPPPVSLLLKEKERKLRGGGRPQKKSILVKMLR